MRRTVGVLLAAAAAALVSGSSSDEGWDLFVTGDNTTVPRGTPLSVTGEIPAWLNDITLVRNGPGQFEIGNRSVTHLFDGFAKLHAWTMHGGNNVTYGSRMLNVPLYEKGIAEGTVVPAILMAKPDPCFTVWGKFAAMSAGSENFNVNVWKVGDSYLATTDQGKQWTWETEQLESMGEMKWPDHLGNSLMGASHPHLLANDSTTSLFYMGHIGVPGIGLPYKQSVFAVGADKQRHVVAEWDFPDMHGSYVHSFGMSTNYAIVANMAWKFSWSKIMGNPVLLNNAIYANDTAPFEADIVDLRNGAHRHYVIPDLVVTGFHHINSYESDDGNTLVVDVIVYENLDGATANLYLDVMKNATARNTILRGAPSSILRLKVDNTLEPGAPGAISYSLMPLQGSDGTPWPVVDMPRFNYDRRGTKICYWYGLSFYAGNSTEYTDMAVTKTNMCAPETEAGTAAIVEASWLTPSHYPSEPVFVPSPNPTSEDDGVLLTAVLDGTKGVSYLAVLDAQTMELVAKAEGTEAIPFGFHGQVFEGI